MIHGVLDQRLQNEQRHADLQQPRLDVNRDGESVAESYLQDVEIRLENGELLSQGDFLDILGIKAQAQKISKLCHHLVCGVDIAVHQGRDRVERIEEEMWLKLVAKYLQPGLR